MENIMMRAKGSMTVFAALSLLLVASFLFALLEGARAQGLDTCADLISDIALHSVCAEYQPVIWDDYKLLMLDGAYASGEFSVEKMNSRLCTRIAENAEESHQTVSGMSLYQLFLQEAEITDYQLVTDGEGEIFFQCVTAYMKNNLTREAAKKLYDSYQEGKKIEESERGAYSVEDASSAIETAKKAQEEAAAGENADGAMDVVDSVKKYSVVTAEQQENPLEIVMKLKGNALLGMVLEEGASLSQKQIDLSESVSKRENEVGTMEVVKQTGWYEKILITEYADSYFSSYLNPREKDALAYGMEYMLCGENSDVANLDGTVKRLLAMREAANVIALSLDETKRSEAKAAAAVIASAVANPELTTIIQCGIIAAWAYAESLLDMRALLDGRKIALVKNEKQWTSNTSNLIDSLKDGAKAIDCENGLTYTQYIKQFLTAMGNRKLAYRMLDIIEQNVRMTEGNEEVRMDQMVCRMKSTMSYQAGTLFAKLSFISPNMLHHYSFVKMKEFNYIR